MAMRLREESRFELTWYCTLITLLSHRLYVVAAPRDQAILAFMNYGMYKFNLFISSKTAECCVYGLTLPLHMIPFIPSKVQTGGG